MGAYLRCKLVDPSQALAADDFVQTIKENQELMKLGRGVYFTCIKDINEVEQSDKSEQHKKNIIAMLKDDIGRVNYKVSGFESEDIDGMSMHKFYHLLAGIFIQINKKFKMKYLHTSCALDMTFRFFCFDDMKAMTQSGKLLSGKSIDLKGYKEKEEILKSIAIPFFKGGNHGDL
ncbi:hypothetical protein [Candidatus Thiodubiliella endoseptemdiera]|uniref:hypothetical protein n=1 Tax=Candidatus Thiodubiliella endoseptemdiera TaxID=2738886 RepID=UPI0034DFA5C3